MKSQCKWKAAGVCFGVSVTGTECSIGLFVTLKSLLLGSARALHEGLLVSSLIYGKETLGRRESESSLIKAVQLDDYRVLLTIRRIARIPNARIVWREGWREELKNMYHWGKSKTK